MRLDQMWLQSDLVAAHRPGWRAEVSPCLNRECDAWRWHRPNMECGVEERIVEVGQSSRACGIQEQRSVFNRGRGSTSLGDL